MNSIILIGRLTKDPELKYLQNGSPNCTFTIAVDKGYSRDKRQEAEAKGQPTADFIRIVTWGKVAENCANYIKKGSQVCVQGKLQTNNYTDAAGIKRYMTDVNAAVVEFLEWSKPDERHEPEEYTPPTGNDDIPF